jgi:hypothetical protein
LTNNIASGLSFVASAPITIVRSTLTRVSIATRMNEQGFIDIIPVDTPRFDHDPITLLSKGLLLRDARANIILQYDEVVNTSRWV